MPKYGQIELNLWSPEDEDPNEPPFVHAIKSAKTTKPPKLKSPISVFDLAKKPIKVTSIQPDDAGAQPREWVREGGRITGWGEMRRRRWEETERDRKSKTVPPKTPEKARTKSKKFDELLNPTN